MIFLDPNCFNDSIRQFEYICDKNYPTVKLMLENDPLFQTLSKSDNFTVKAESFKSILISCKPKESTPPKHTSFFLGMFSCVALNAVSLRPDPVLYGFDTAALDDDKERMESSYAHQEVIVEPQITQTVRDHQSPVELVFNIAGFLGVIDKRETNKYEHWMAQFFRTYLTGLKPILVVIKELGPKSEAKVSMEGKIIFRKNLFSRLGLAHFDDPATWALLKALPKFVLTIEIMPDEGFKPSTMYIVEILDMSFAFVTSEVTDRRKIFYKDRWVQLDTSPKEPVASVIKRTGLKLQESALATPSNFIVKVGESYVSNLDQINTVCPKPFQDVFIIPIKEDPIYLLFNKNGDADGAEPMEGVGEDDVAEGGSDDEDGELVDKKGKGDKMKIEMSDPVDE